jgi:hypothetical protein
MFHKLTVAKSMASIVSLTALSVFIGGQPAKAGLTTCSTGNNWVSMCKTGIYNFSNSITTSINIFSPNNQSDFSVVRSGTTSIVIGNPTNEIISDLLLGNVGSLAQQPGVLQLELFKTNSTGLLPFAPVSSTVISGDGIPDLAATPPATTLPYTSLYSAGVIVQRQDDPTLADSFLKIFIEAEGAEGLLRNKQAITAVSVSPLTGFPQTGQQNPIVYDIVPLYLAGPDGIFWTGDEIEFATIVPDTSGKAVVFSITPVPEPSTWLSSLVAGLGLMWGVKRKRLVQN